MRKPIAPCACVLALLTGVWAGQAYSLFAPPEPIGATDTSSPLAAGTAWRFYDAIDTILRTGDDGALRAVIDPDFVDHPDEPAAASGRDEFLGYLASLRETYPALRLVPEEVIAQGDRVVARLVLSGDADGAILGIPLAGVSPWPRVDVVRVRGDRIVERWGSPAGYAPSAVLVSETLTFSDHGDMVPFLRRVTFAPGAGYQTTGQPGPVIVSVESGALDIGTVGTNGSPSPTAGGSQEFGPIEPSASRTLGPGDMIVIPEGVALAAYNRADAPAVILLLELVQPVATATRASDGRASLPPMGITVQALAGYTVTLPDAGRVSARLARVTLAPGARLAAHAVAGVELVAVDAGALTATVEGEAFAASLRDPGGRSVVPGSSARVAEGYGLSVSGEAVSTSYRNETDRPVTLLLLTLLAK